MEYAMEQKLRLDSTDSEFGGDDGPIGQFFGTFSPCETDLTSAYATRVDTCRRIYRTRISSAGRSATDPDEAIARPRAEFVHQLLFTLSRQPDNFGHQPRKRISMTSYSSVELR